MFQKKVCISEAAAQGIRAAKVMSYPLIPLSMLTAQIVVLWLSAKGSLFPGADTFISIVSTCAQIIAGLYGITLAGYTFFLSRIDALSASDVTLDYVVASIKRRFQYLIWYITSNVLMTLVISVVLMYCSAPIGDTIGFFYRFFCNEFVMFMGFSTGLILWYSLLVVDPNCIEKEARKLKRRLCRPGPAGSAVEFISLYTKIEDCCHTMLPQSVLSQLHKNKGKHFELTLELLEEQKLLPNLLILDLTRIHRYYECTVNCSPMEVSQEMCLTARKALIQLQKTIAT